MECRLYTLMKRTVPFHLAATSLVVIVGTVVGSAQVQLAIQPGVALSWPTVTNDSYQLQWSPNPGFTWNNLGGQMTGNGATNSLYDPMPGGTRSYQVLEMVPGSTPSPASAIVNGGFESGSGTTASNWSVDTAAGGPVYGGPARTTTHAAARLIFRSIWPAPGPAQWCNSTSPACQ